MTHQQQIGIEEDEENALLELAVGYESCGFLSRSQEYREKLNECIRRRLALELQSEQVRCYE
jgi:hypothetical protein